MCSLIMDKLPISLALICNWYSPKHEDNESNSDNRLMFNYLEHQDHKAVTIENLLGLAHLTERSDRLHELDEGQIDNFEGLVGNVAAPYRSNDGIGEHVYRIGDTVEARYELNRGEYISGWFQA